MPSSLFKKHFFSTKNIDLSAILYCFYDIIISGIESYDGCKSLLKGMMPMSVKNFAHILKKGYCKMSVYEALSLMIAFATLIVLVNNKDNKK